MGKAILIHIDKLTEYQKELLRQFFIAAQEEYLLVSEDFPAVSPLLAIGRLYLHPHRRQVWMDGKPVDLTPMEFEILHFLARRPGHVFTARQIYEATVSNTTTGSWTGISNMVYQLRRKLGSDLIENVYGYGYRLYRP